MSIPKVRTTVTLDHDLVERFAEVASKEQRSFSATINGWLQQVIEPAEFVAAQIDHDRAASAQRLRTLMGSIQVVNDESAQALSKAKGVPRAGQAGGAALRGAPIPPPCNTGGKVPAKGAAISADNRGGKPHD